MPYVKNRTYRSYRRPRYYRRKAYRSRRRFSKKKFFKYSTKQKTAVRANVNARETYVKLPMFKTFQETVPGSGSSSICVLGNSLVPFPTSYASVNPAAGDTWVSGVQEYSNFYNNYRVLGCSVKMQIVTLNTGNAFQCVLIPVTAAGPETYPGFPPTVADRITELDALTYDELCTQPYAQMRTIGVSTGGPNQFSGFKMFRKTKSMLACKDLRDNEDTLLDLPDPDGSQGKVLVSPDSAWFYYFRIFNLSGTNQVANINFKLKYYTNLSGRTNWLPINVPA